MKCQSCGSENEDEVLCCTLCSIVLQKPAEPAPPPKPEPAAAPAAPAPAAAASGEPARLDGPDAQSALIALAQERMLADDMPEAARLMARLFLEAAPSDSEYHLMQAGEDWLKEAYLGVEDETMARESIAAAAKAVSVKDFASGQSALKNLYPLVKLDLTPGWKFVMFTLGLKGAAAKKSPDQ